MQEGKYNILVAAGGTGGHLFPAIAVVQELEKITDNQIKASFVGTSSRIESRLVPSLGYDFYTIPIIGFKSLLSINTILLPLKIYKSIRICRQLIQQIKPEAILCTGAYISYPAGVAAQKENIPLVLMESNVYPGKAIRMLATGASIIITAFDETAGFLPQIDKNKIFTYGNPIRNNFNKLPTKEKARISFGLKPEKRTILIFGGSLGARTINQAVEKIIYDLINFEVQIIWQTGKDYTVSKELTKNVKVMEFIDDMASAYSAADLVISRSGATTIAELCSVGKPSLLVPLPSAANNEQASNAQELAIKGAAVIINNSDLENELLIKIEMLLSSPGQLKSMGYAASALCKKNAAENSARKIIEIIEKKFNN